MLVLACLTSFYTYNHSFCCILFDIGACFTFFTSFVFSDCGTTTITNTINLNDDTIIIPIQYSYQHFFKRKTDNTTNTIYSILLYYRIQSNSILLPVLSLTIPAPMIVWITPVILLAPITFHSAILLLPILSLISIIQYSNWQCYK